MMESSALPFEENAEDVRHTPRGANREYEDSLSPLLERKARKHAKMESKNETADTHYARQYLELKRDELRKKGTFNISSPENNRHDFIRDEVNMPSSTQASGRKRRGSDTLMKTGSASMNMVMKDGPTLGGLGDMKDVLRSLELAAEAGQLTASLMVDKS